MHSEQVCWPKLQYNQGAGTLATVHRWLQIIGKIRLSHMPWINPRHVALYPTPLGLSTGPMSYAQESFQIDFDFIGHSLHIITSKGQQRRLPLQPQLVADFYAALMDTLQAMGFATTINLLPHEIPDPIAFPDDHDHADYHRSSIESLQRALT